MTAGTASPPVEATRRRLPATRPGAVVTRAAVGQLRRGTAVVVLIAGVLPAFVAAQHRATFGGVMTTSSLTALAENPAIRTLFGPPVALDDPGGFTVWRVGTPLAVLVGTWAALTATRITRGEEEAGRWDLLLAGGLALRSMVLRHLLVLLAAAILIGAAVTGGMVAAGTSAAGAAVFGAAVAGTAMTGASLGVLAAQLRTERRSASGLAVGILLGGLLARMVGDGVAALGGLHWLSPFGLLGRAAPYAEDHLPALAVLAVVAAVPAVGAVHLAAGRDVGSGRWRGSARASAPSRLLRSPAGLSVHRTRRPVLVWGAGLAAYYLLIGLLATSMVDFLRENPRFAEMAAEAGIAELGSVQGFGAALFTLLAVPVGALAAARLAATAADETAGRLALLYSRPLSRVRWLLLETGTVAGGCVVLAGVAGLAAWTGTTVVGAGLGAGEALAGVLNVVPLAVLCLGAALLALGRAPSAVGALGVLPAAGGYLLLVFADTFGWPSWIRALSPFAHLAAVPAEPWNAGGALGMVVVGTVAGAVGLAGYARRDLRG